MHSLTFAKEGPFNTIEGVVLTYEHPVHLPPLHLYGPKGYLSFANIIHSVIFIICETHVLHLQSTSFISCFGKENVSKINWKTFYLHEKRKVQHFKSAQELSNCVSVVCKADLNHISVHVHY